MLVTTKSQKMPNHTNTCGHQTPTIMCKTILTMPNHKRYTSKNMIRLQLFGCYVPSGQHTQENPAIRSTALKTDQCLSSYS